MGKILSRLQNQKTTMDVVDKLLVNQTLLGAFKITKPFESSRVETTSFNTRKCLIDGNLRPEYSTSSSTNLGSWRVRISSVSDVDWEKLCQTASIYFFGFVSVTINEGSILLVDALSQHLQLSMLWPLMRSNHPTKGRVLKKVYF